MKYLSSLMVIHCVLVIHTPKGVYLQETTPALLPPTPAPPPTPAATTPAFQPPTPAPLPTPPATTPPSAIPAEVVAYINDRIDATLAVNPEKDFNELLFTVFNDERRRLLDARIGQTVQAGDDARAEEALRSFNRFLNEYNNISSRLEEAASDLNRMETNPDQPISVRYQALMLLNELRDSNSIEEAQRALENINNFKENLTTSPEVTTVTSVTPATTLTTPITSVLPPLSAEHRQYLEEILRTLRQFGMNENDPKVLWFLKKLLLRPTDLKALATDARRLLRRFLRSLG